MSTTVIVIKGNSSQSLLNRIAQALTDEDRNAQTTEIKQNLVRAFSDATQLKTEENKKERKKHEMTYRFDSNQEKLVRAFINKNPSFTFNQVCNFLRNAGYEKVYFRDLKICLTKFNATCSIDSITRKHTWIVKNVRK